jgi:hypothetical protein
VCQSDQYAAQRERAADRAVLYGAILAAQRPGLRLKPGIAEAAYALVPAVRAFLDGRDDAQADIALTYARDCGAADFLLEKRARKHTRS